MILLSLSLQGVLPLALIVWVALAWSASRASWYASVALAAALIAAITLAGLWLVLPWWITRVYAVLLVIAVIRSWTYIRRGPVWPSTPLAWVGFGISTLGATAFAAVALQAAAGHRSFDGPAVELQPPLRGGTFMIANGGSNRWVNAHVHTLDVPDYRGQSRALDIVQVGRWGSRESGLRPADPARYAIFGEPVYSPCTGRIVEALDGLPDLPPPQSDRENLEGNFVIVACDGAWIVLAHFRQGSVRVQAGDAVAVGDRLGEVGNSGNTDEPHLHMHAQTPVTVGPRLSGEPLAMRIAGRQLTRNDRLTF